MDPESASRQAFPPPARAAVARAQSIVLKIGTRVLTGPKGTLARSRLDSIVETVVALRRRDRHVLIVSSGAVGLGKEALGLEGTPLDLEERQACAAVGQTRLMAHYEESFSRRGHLCAQVLLTQEDFDHRVRYLNLRSTLMTLLRCGVIPVINENDAVSTEELEFVEGEARPVFGDNDVLSALVATKLAADLLILLTDVDGLYDRDPRSDGGARIVDTIDTAGPADLGAGGPGTPFGRGGMRSKVKAAHMVALAGGDAVIGSGVAPGVLEAILAGEAVGTWFPSRGELAGRRRWIAFAASPKGSLALDPGAVTALRERGASLLASGVERVEGDFRTGDVVELRGPDDALVGRGMAYCDAETARRWCGGDPPAGVRNHHALVHRDHIVLESWR